MDTIPMRQPNAAVDLLFVDRWSPRAFAPDPVPRDTLMQLFEAARWAPSAMNEQPARFLYADTPETLDLFRPLLMPANRVWADRAPVLAFVLSKRKYDHNDRPNRTYQFDAGAAWMSLALQARMLGLYTHGMAGIHVEEAYDALNVSKDDYEIIAAVAIGQMGDASKLPDKVREREVPSGRKALADIAIAGGFPR